MTHGLVRRIILANLAVIILAGLGLALVHREVTSLEAEEQALVEEARAIAMALSLAAATSPTEQAHRLSRLVSRLAEMSGREMGLYARGGFAVRARPEAVTVRRPLPGGDVGFFARTSRDVGRFIISREVDASGKPRPLAVPSHVAQAFEGIDNAVIRRVSADNAAVAAVAVTLYGDFFILDVTFPESRLFRAMEREGRAYILYFAAVLLATIAVSVWLGLSIARPLGRLAQRSHVIAGRTEGVGEVDPSPLDEFASRGDEIGKLGAAMREMVASLKKRLTAVDDFAADVAHELKNPLTALTTSVELLGRPHDEARQKKLIIAMERDIRRLGRLIDDIQAATRLDRALGDGPGMNVDPVKLLTEIIDIRRARAQLDGVALLLEGSSQGRQILGRGEQLGHALGNLIDNALSFSNKGNVIRLTMHEEHHGLVILIDDDGPGIPKDQRERVFERFYSSRPGEKGHSGLGLPIARQIIRRHGGDITLDASPTGGLRVQVFLPWGHA